MLGLGSVQIPAICQGFLFNQWQSTFLKQRTQHSVTWKRAVCSESLELARGDDDDIIPRSHLTSVRKLSPQQSICTAGAVVKAKHQEAGETITPTGLGRITRGAAAVLSRSANVISAHLARTLRSAA